MIELQGLTKRYGDKTAVDHLTFTVRPGAVTGFLGPNGSGKTTTMRMMLDLDRPTSGSVRIDGQRYSDMQEPMKRVGSLLDAKALHPSRSAYHHLLWLAQSNRVPNRRVDEVLEIVGISDVAHQRAGVFSLGMGQRLGIAAALLGDPEILVLDEPVNGLDPEGIRWIRTFMREMAGQGRTVLVSSHLLSEVQQSVDRLVIISRGRLMYEGTLAGLDTGSRVVVDAPDRAALETALTQAGADVHSASGALTVTGLSSAEVGAIAHNAGVPLSQLAAENNRLEAAFLEIVGDTGLGGEAERA